MSAERLDAVVSGRVQGVGFRWFVREQAQSLGLTGAVRNEPNGRLAVAAEGERAALEALVVRLREGPPAARVDGVEARWGPAAGTFNGFRVER